MKKLFSILLLFACLSSISFAQSVIIPQPNSIVASEGTISLSGVVTYGGNNSKALYDYLSTELKNRHDITLKKSAKDSKLVIEFSDKKESEAYTLTITPAMVKISADSETGAFYGVQSLLQLMRAGGAKLSAQTITDAPRFSWRSYLLDEARFFQGEKQVKMMLDVMAELKMNVFHWHLTDDQGWRVESKKYPLLTEIGSKRTDTQKDGFNSTEFYGKPHEGFYTQKQIKDIVAYAKARHIKIVPEIEMPGHATAAIAAYSWLGSDGKDIEVSTKFGKHYPIFNVSDPKVMAFLKDVVSEMIDLFECDIIHIGGDEVRFNQWEENPQIAKYKESKGYSSFMDLQIECTNEMSQFIASKGVSMMGWNEILGKNLHTDDKIAFSTPSQKIASNVIVQFWKGDPKDMAVAAKDGYRIVNSYHFKTYLDYDYKAISLKNAYEYDPIPEGLDKEYEKNIIGAGCQMWGEWLSTSEKMHLQTFPRIAAYAEIGWSELNNKNYSDFLGRIRLLSGSWSDRGIAVKSDEIK